MFERALTLVQFMHEKCVHELIVGFQMSVSVDLDLNADLDLDLDDYLLHPQTPPCLRVIHAFMCTDREIEHVREETVRIEDGVLRQEQLIWCIKQQQQQQKHLEQQFGGGLMKHFKLRAMFLYNMDLNAEDMRDFFRSHSQSL